MAIGAKGAINAMKDDGFNRMINAVNVVRNETLITLSGNRSGEIYQVNAGKVSQSRAAGVKSGLHYQIKPSSVNIGGKTRRTYTASAPGEAPAVLTGQLRQSIKATVDIEGSNIVGRIGSDLPYAKRLEFGYMGTDSKGRKYTMAARPWLKPSCEKAEPEIRRVLWL